MMNLFQNRWFLIVITPLLLGFSWFPAGFPLFIFMAFVPLLLLTDQLREGKWKNYQFFFLSFFIIGLFNLITSWWVAKAGGAIGVVAPVLVNGIVMSIPLTFYFHLTKKLESKYHTWVFIALWTAMEYFHSMDWDLSWPWMHLGNALSPYHYIYQWIEYTGVRGLTIWILAVNMGLYKWLRIFLSQQGIKHKSFAVNLGFRLILPILISVLMLGDDFQGETKKVRLVQPNLDPYTAKFDQTKYRSHEDLLAKLSFPKGNFADLIVLPETAFPQGVWEETVDKNTLAQLFQSYRRTNRSDMVITGVSSYRRVDNVDETTAKISHRKNKYGYYEAYNAAMYLIQDTMGFYHKSRLVAGVEQMPFAESMPFLKKFARDLGGTTGVLGKQKEREVFEAKGMKVAPIICYESVYSEYVTEYVNKGANLLAIITNDGWWGNTPGYKHHFHYARLRAVENNRYVVRSANTGISGIIDPNGKIVDSLEFWKEGVVEGNVKLIEGKTFFTKYGDWLGRLGAIAAFYFILVGYVKKYREMRVIQHK